MWINEIAPNSCINWQLVVAFDFDEETNEGGFVSYGPFFKKSVGGKQSCKYTIELFCSPVSVFFFCYYYCCYDYSSRKAYFVSSF